MSATPGTVVRSSARPGKPSPSPLITSRPCRPRPRVSSVREVSLKMIVSKGIWPSPGLWGTSSISRWVQWVRHFSLGPLLTARIGYQHPDLPLNEQMVSPEPDVVERRLTEKDEFLIVACDGGWTLTRPRRPVRLT